MKNAECKMQNAKCKMKDLKEIRKNLLLTINQELRTHLSS